MYVTLRNYNTYIYRERELNKVSMFVYAGAQQPRSRRFAREGNAPLSPRFFVFESTVQSLGQSR
jgi:hypothetical protein